MTFLVSFRTVLLGAAALAAGCAHGLVATPDPAPPPSDCASLGHEVLRAEAALQRAREQEQSAWKAVVPFAVAARHAKGRSARVEAERELAALQAAQRQQGCSGHAG